MGIIFFLSMLILINVFYFRIQGRQTVAPIEDGYRWYSSQPSEAASSTAYGSTHGRDSNE